MVDEGLESPNWRMRMQAVTRRALTARQGQDLYNMFVQASRDLDRRVRFIAVQQLDLCRAAFPLFLVDPDPQVRACVIRALPSLVDFKTLKAQKLLDHLMDDQEMVRAAFGDMMEDYFDQLELDDLGHYIATMSRDWSGSVRISAANMMIRGAKVHGLDFVLQQLNSSLVAQMKDEQWRVRQVAAETVCAVVVAAKSDELYQGTMEQPIMAFLRDPAEPVRRRTAACMWWVYRSLTPACCEKIFLPGLRKLWQSSNYFVRKTYLEVIADLPIPDQHRPYFLVQPLIRALDDPAPGVVACALRLVTGRIGVMHPFLINHELKPALERVVNRLTGWPKTAAADLLAKPELK